MDEVDRDFEILKRNVILTIMKNSFEEGCRDYIETGKWKTIEELDEWIGDYLKQYMKAKNEVKNYYNEKLYS